jgi:hypothetical protein|tara:strand:- start:961 stop:1227 length:267 start_codon:yes stop_codon:yes gene_type:complete
MKAIPVIRPATVIGVLQLVDTESLSIKKKAVAANMPIEISQKVIPTKSSEANNIVSAFAAKDKPTRVIIIRTNNIKFFIKTPQKINLF